MVNLLFSKQQTTLRLAEKFYFYRRGRGGQIIEERKSNAPMVCSLPKINTPFCRNLPAIDSLDNKKANQNGKNCTRMQNTLSAAIFPKKNTLSAKNIRTPLFLNYNENTCEVKQYIFNNFIQYLIYNLLNPS